ncbi:hypothetical protein CEXT_249751 [Caerostris extrusa]|uniref:Uncharacterized protein n=1 Tax=Caerostris extrusa TaxID=172846 RepID=A0AAV4T7R3_CAEEX|nr:hypothetical protein CEXT_249751 [Caerostris extrusa]
MCALSSPFLEEYSSEQLRSKWQLSTCTLHERQVFLRKEEIFVLLPSERVEQRLFQISVATSFLRTIRDVFEKRKMNVSRFPHSEIP